MDAVTHTSDVSVLHVVGRWWGGGGWWWVVVVETVAMQVAVMWWRWRINDGGGIENATCQASRLTIGSIINTQLHRPNMSTSGPAAFSLFRLVAQTGERAWYDHCAAELCGGVVSAVQAAS